MYNIKSQIAEEFINDSEIRETMAYARENSNNIELIKSILQKARDCKGISHREAALLLECNDQEIINEIYDIAREIKHKFYGNRIVMFAPLYLSNYCVNGCVYCPYHLKNKNIRRKKLSQEEIRQEVIALQDMGHKRLALEAGEHPVENPIEYILESIKTIYSIKHKNGAIRRVNVNIAATTVENYQKLRDAGIGTYILFQETYNKENYEATIESVAFNDNTLERINEWCSKMTKGKIPTILDDIKPNDRMYLINALYFNAIWNKKFNIQECDNVAEFDVLMGHEIAQQIRLAKEKGEKIAFILPVGPMGMYKWVVL